MALSFFGRMMATALCLVCCHELFSGMKVWVQGGDRKVVGKDYTLISNGKANTSWHWKELGMGLSIVLLLGSGNNLHGFFWMIFYELWSDGDEMWTEECSEEAFSTISVSGSKKLSG